MPGETWERVEQEKVTTAWERSVIPGGGCAKCSLCTGWVLSPAVSSALSRVTWACEQQRATAPSQRPNLAAARLGHFLEELDSICHVLPTTQEGTALF